MEKVAIYCRLSEEDRNKRVAGWNKAVRCVYGWAKDEE